jgi:hypothetical protein
MVVHCTPAAPLRFRQVRLHGARLAATVARFALNAFLHCDLVRKKFVEIKLGVRIKIPINH